MSQMMKLLLAYDGSSFADLALADLRRAGLPPHVEATVFSVADVWGPPAPPADYAGATTAQEIVIRSRAEELRKQVETAVEAARTLAMEAAQKVQAEFPAWELRAQASYGAPAWELLKKAEEWQPDLLLMGTHGRGALGRLLLGSVSQKLLNEAHCSVRIARQHAASAETAPRILIAVDGSEHAEAAVQVVAARTWPWGTEIRLLAVDDPFEHPAAGYLRWPIGQPSPADEAASKRWVQSVIEGPTQTLRKLGRSVSHTVKWGDARNVILEEAAAWQADMVFMGARGRGRFHRLLLGSVSSAVAARASCTVEVVRTVSAKQEERLLDD